MIRLQTMTEAEYEVYLARTVVEYAAEHVRAGNWDEADALRLSQESFAKLLPEGVHSPQQHLYTLVAEDEADLPTPTPVGILWFAEMDWGGQQAAFIYDFYVDEAYRRRGFASAALRAVEDEVRALGVSRIGLHVFGHNHAARDLYSKLGYDITDLHMMKTLT